MAWRTFPHPLRGPRTPSRVRTAGRPASAHAGGPGGGTGPSGPVPAGPGGPPRPAPRTGAARGRAALTAAAAAVRGAAVRARGLRHPVLAVARGLRRQSGWLRAWWSGAPRERRGPALFLAAAFVLAVSLVPGGPALAIGALLLSAAWTGRRPGEGSTGAGEAEEARLNRLHEALTPCFSTADHPSPLYAHGGRWDDAFTEHAFDGDGRVSRLGLRYPAWFADQDSASRARVEHVLRAKAGRDREYRFTWNEEDDRLLMAALPPLATDIGAQRFVTAPGESVLGFTDPGSVRRTTPVTTTAGHTRHEPPVIWRTGPRSPEPHLLALGHPGSGTTTLLRSLALQALHHGDIVVLDGTGTGEYACLAGRPGVLAVESGPTGARAVLEWAVHETERRLTAVNRARRSGRTPPADVRRPLWIILDRPASITQAAASGGGADPQILLDTPLRYGRAASVTVAAADTLDATAALSPALAAHCRARIALGPLTPEQAHHALGAPPATTPVPEPPPGRGYARLGGGPVQRLQVPYTPDPYDEEADGTLRAAVHALLAPRHGPAEGVPAPGAVPRDASFPADPDPAAGPPARTGGTAAGAPTGTGPRPRGRADARTGPRPDVPPGLHAGARDGIRPDVRADVRAAAHTGVHATGRPGSSSGSSSGSGSGSGQAQATNTSAPSASSAPPV